MKNIEFQNISAFQSILLISLMFISACDNDTQVTNNAAQNTSTTPTETFEPPLAEPITLPEPELENKSYLFDVSQNSIEELKALLVRAEEVSQTHPADFEDLEIVMVIHGPDIDLFTNKNYGKNQELIDLAARLDAYDVIDMKVCERTMESRGVERKDIPPFIESVPFAPVEIKQRLQNGYINF